MQTMLLALLCFCGSVVRAQVPDVFAGRPAFSDKESPSYYVWHDGNRWHVRWSSLSRVRNFKGSVVADSGSLGDLRQADRANEFGAMYPNHPQLLTVTVGRPSPNDLSSATPFESSVRMKGKQTITFSSKTSDSVDGFDFTPDDAVHTLTFDLMIEGKPAEAIIHLGSESSPPDSLPIVVALRH